MGVRRSDERRSAWRWKHTVVAWEAKGSGLNVAGARHMVRKSDGYVNDHKGLVATSQPHKWFEGLLHLEIQNVFVDVGRRDEPAGGASIDAVQSHVGRRAARAGQRLIIRLVRIDRHDFEEILEVAVEIGNQGAPELAARPLFA